MSKVSCNSLTLKQPLQITPRLLPGLHIGDVFVSIRYGKPTRDGRIAYHYSFDAPTWEYEAADLSSGVGGGTLQQGLASLMSFLSAYAEACEWEDRHDDISENGNLFPPIVRDWAMANSDEFGMLAIELEETPDLIC